MDRSLVGKNIAELRKKYGWTQFDLANKLRVSDKAISKWECGTGYPEITQLPALAEIFNVSVDYLLRGEHRGIVIAGSIIIDNLKVVESYPERGMLTNIISTSKAVGGCVSNTLIDLAIIDKKMPLTAIGRVGDDENGRYIISQLQKHNIDTSNIKITDGVPTAFSDVITEKTDGARTFFCNSGANDIFSPEDIPVETLNCDMLHIGYILLLKMFDMPDSEYGTVMARFLKRCQDNMIKTSFDVVSDSSGLFKEKVMPALKYTNYCIINEIEACGVSGLDPRNPDGTVNVENIRKTMELFFEYGVKDKVIIHCKEAGFCLSSNGEFTSVGSVDVPAEMIKGACGAGDAFCAGCLYAIYNGMEDLEMLEFASGAAVCNLSSEDSVGGMKNKDEILKIVKKYGRMKY